jgi:mRNA-degrading endonuclease YafQ of YafQ-DinJ toxin-antitoxin module
MYELKPTKYFSKKLQKFLKQNQALKSKISESFKLLEADPTTSKLRTHKVNTPKFGEANSSRVTGDIRIIWIYGQNKEVKILELIDIGGHSGNRGVY